MCSFTPEECSSRLEQTTPRAATSQAWKDCPVELATSSVASGKEALFSLQKGMSCPDSSLGNTTQRKSISGVRTRARKWGHQRLGFFPWPLFGSET